MKGYVCGAQGILASRDFEGVVWNLIGKLWPVWCCRSGGCVSPAESGTGTHPRRPQLLISKRKNSSTLNTGLTGGGRPAAVRTPTAPPPPLDMLYLPAFAPPPHPTPLEDVTTLYSASKALHGVEKEPPPPPPFGFLSPVRFDIDCRRLPLRQSSCVLWTFLVQIPNSRLRRRSPCSRGGPPVALKPASVTVQSPVIRTQGLLVSTLKPALCLWHICTRSLSGGRVQLHQAPPHPRASALTPQTRTADSHFARFLPLLNSWGRWGVCVAVVWQALASILFAGSVGSLKACSALPPAVYCIL